MRRFIALALLLFASAVHAGVTYRFDSTGTGIAEQRMSGSVKAEGSSVRIDLARGDGNFFKDGSVIVSTDGGKTLTVSDPKTRTYYVLNLSDILAGANSIGQQFGGLMDVKNPRVTVRDGGPAGKIEGYSVRKSTVDSSYELAIKGLGEKKTIRMQMTTDLWWTDKVPAEFTNFLQMRGVRTGVEAVDKLLAAQTAAIKGFPLKQVTTSRVFMGRDPMVTTTTSTVTGLRRAVIPAAEFAAPSGFRKTDSPIDRMMKQLGK